MKPPAAESEQLTVERALAELREMFPRRSIGVTAFLCPNEYRVSVAGGDEYEKVFEDSTLTEAMDRVRKWHKEQQG